MMLFPLRFRPVESYHVKPRRFGADRPCGRKHAGCDLYAPVGTEILAVADGQVLRVEKVTAGNPNGFYGGTGVVEVDHDSFVVRYGEVNNDIPVKAGDFVQRGAIVAHVGKLNNCSHSMLHFEMYAGTLSGALTVVGNPPFKRRADLMDPTDYLDTALLDSGVLLSSQLGPVYPTMRCDLLSAPSHS